MDRIEPGTLSGTPDPKLEAARQSARARQTNPPGMMEPRLHPVMIPPEPEIPAWEAGFQVPEPRYIQRPGFAHQTWNDGDHVQYNTHRPWAIVVRHPGASGVAWTDHGVRHELIPGSNFSRIAMPRYGNTALLVEFERVRSLDLTTGSLAPLLVSTPKEGSLCDAVHVHGDDWLVVSWRKIALVRIQPTLSVLAELKTSGRPVSLVPGALYVTTGSDGAILGVAGDKIKKLWSLPSDVKLAGRSGGRPVLEVDGRGYQVVHVEPLYQAWAAPILGKSIKKKRLFLN